jgi:hypothetical protein
MAAPNACLAELSKEDRQVLEGWLVEFDQSWDESRLATRVRALPGPAHLLRRPALVEMVKIDLGRQWERGQRPAVDVNPLAWQSPPLLQPSNEGPLQGRWLHGGEGASESIVGGDAVGPFQEGAEEGRMVACPIGDRDEVIAVGQDAAEADEQDIDQAVLEVPALPSGVRDGLQLLQQGTRPGEHGESFPRQGLTRRGPRPKVLILRTLKCACRAKALRIYSTTSRPRPRLLIRLGNIKSHS